MAKYYYEGKQIGKTEALAKPVMAVGLNPNEPETAVVFDDQANLIKYVAQRKDADTLAKAFEQIESVRKLAGQDVRLQRKRQVDVTNRIRTELEELAAAERLDVNSQALFDRATFKADPLTGPIFNSCQLFEHPNCTGRRVDVAAWTGFPELAWHNFNDITSSIRVAPGFAILFEHIWYNIHDVLGGRLTFYFGGVWWSNEYNVNEYMNDRASSVWTT